MTADVFLAATPQPVQVRGVLMATDRELGLGETTGPQPALPSELNTGAVVCEAAARRAGRSTR